MFSWKLNRLNTRSKISAFLLIIILLLICQMIFIINQYPDILSKPKKWWNKNYKSKINHLGDEMILKNVSSLTKIQYNFPYSNLKNQFIETSEEKYLREYRKESIKKGFLHAWKGYVKYAWGADEILPLTNRPRNNFNGWGATMVDALDTMWIMNLKEEFNNATEFIANVNFTKSHTTISVFETTIRYLGGLLSAYELSGNEILLEKAKELGEAMIPSFNSPTGVPYNTWNLTRGLIDDKFRPYVGSGILSQAGTLQLEYMKLAQLTGNSSFFYKVQNVTDVLDRAHKEIPGLYPVHIDHETGIFKSGQLSFGGEADSFYEYLIKQYIFVGGAIDQYRRMYEESIDSMHKYLVKEGQVKNHSDFLFIGAYSHGSFISKMEHLTCFVPGMLAIGAKILNRPKDLDVAIKLGEACYWAYSSTPTGIGPEDFHFLLKNVTLDKQSNWRLSIEKDIVFPDGVYKMNGNYLLRPETIESLFILYRVTGDKSYQEKGWKIWQSIERWCRTESAYSGLYHVATKKIIQNDNMESFFLAETLKYLYLLFSTPDVISLDDYVFNTEAHPFLRMKP